MRTIRIGNTVQAFLNANIRGEVVDIVYVPSAIPLMVGGIPPSEAYANVRLENGKIVRVRTTELFITDA